MANVEDKMAPTFLGCEGKEGVDLVYVQLSEMYQNQILQIIPFANYRQNVLLPKLVVLLQGT